MPNWKEYKVEQFADVVGGGTPSTKEPSYYNGDISWITPKDLTNYDKRFISDGERNITRKGLENSSAKLIPKNSILLTSRAPIGYLAIARNELCTNQGFKSLVVNSRIADYKFVYYLLKSNIEYIKSQGSGTTFAEISGSVVKNLKFKLPDLPTQTAIAEILSSLDDKIELNNQINKELEALAQALFKHWFIDFEFPNEKGQPYKSSGGEMVQSELGEIPKGWKISIFQDHLDVERGLSYKGSGLSDPQNGIPMINLNSVHEGGGYKYEGLKYYSGVYKEKHLIKPWDLAVTNTEQGHKYLLIGFPGVVPKEIGKYGIFSHHIYRVRTKSYSHLSNQFFNYLMLQKSIREQIIGAANGTTVNMLKIHGLENPKFIEPSAAICSSFSQLIESIWEAKENSHSESQALKKLRDSLLPKLISGELEVKDGLTEKAL